MTRHAVAVYAGLAPSWSPLDSRLTWSSPVLGDWSPTQRCIRAPTESAGATRRSEAGPGPGQEAFVPAGHRGLPGDRPRHPGRARRPSRPRIRTTDTPSASSLRPSRLACCEVGRGNCVVVKRALVKILFLQLQLSSSRELVDPSIRLVTLHR